METANRLRPWQELDPRREYSTEQIDAAVQATRDFLATRQGETAAWLYSAGRNVSPSAPATGASPAQEAVEAQHKSKPRRKGKGKGKRRHRKRARARR